jgi:hypothetical protein
MIAEKAPEFRRGDAETLRLRRENSYKCFSALPLRLSASASKVLPDRVRC